MLALLQLLMMISLLAFGTLLVPDVGECWLLSNALGKTNAPATYTLALFASSTTPAEGDTLATYTKAAGGGYADKTLTAANWAAPATVAGVSSTSYAEQTFTFTGTLTTNPNIYGYYWFDSGTLILAERAAASFTPTNNGDTYKVTPYLELS